MARTNGVEGRFQHGHSFSVFLWRENIYAKINFVNLTLLARISITKNMIEQIDKLYVIVIGKIANKENLIEKR